jgi:hypothetical protein
LHYIYNENIATRHLFFLSFFFFFSPNDNSTKQKKTYALFSFPQNLPFTQGLHLSPNPHPQPNDPHRVSSKTQEVHHHLTWSQAEPRPSQSIPDVPSDDLQVGQW